MAPDATQWDIYFGIVSGAFSGATFGLLPASLGLADIALAGGYFGLATDEINQFVHIESVGGPFMLEQTIAAGISGAIGGVAEARTLEAIHNLAGWAIVTGNVSFFLAGDIILTFTEFERLAVAGAGVVGGLVTFFGQSMEIIYRTSQQHENNGSAVNGGGQQHDLNSSPVNGREQGPNFNDFPFTGVPSFG